MVKNVIVLLKNKTKFYALEKYYINVINQDKPNFSFAQ